MWTISHLYLRAQLQVWYISRMYTTSSAAKRALTFGFAVKTTQHFTQMSDFLTFFLFFSERSDLTSCLNEVIKLAEGWTLLPVYRVVFSNTCRQNGLPNRAACDCEELNPFTAMFASPSLGKRPLKVPNLKLLRPLFPFVWTRKSTSVKTRSVESRFVKGPSNMLFAGVYVNTFQPGNFTGRGSERG